MAGEITTTLPGEDPANDGSMAIAGNSVAPGLPFKQVAYVDGDGVFEQDGVGSDFDIAYANIATPYGVEGRTNITGTVTPTNYFYAKDHLGSTRLTLSDDAGTIVENTWYLAYGAISGVANGDDPVGGTAENKTREKFTGKEFDEEGGINLDYFGRRYYDTEIGRWITIDPIPREFDFYIYCMNSPVRLLDPDGMAVIDGSSSRGYLLQSNEQLAADEAQHSINTMVLLNTVDETDRAVTSVGIVMTIAGVIFIPELIIPGMLVTNVGNKLNLLKNVTKSLIGNTPWHQTVIDAMLNYLSSAITKPLLLLNMSKSAAVIDVERNLIQQRIDETIQKDQQSKK